MWYNGLDCPDENRRLAIGICCLHHYKISPTTIIPNFWLEYWQKIEKKQFNVVDRSMLRTSIETFGDEISKDLVEKFMNK